MSIYRLEEGSEDGEDFQYKLCALHSFQLKS